jgi:hypothetical protein
VVAGRTELPPSTSTGGYVAFLDHAGGSGTDSATLAIAHRASLDGGAPGAVVDLIREVRPPFSPEQVCRDFARELKRYGIRVATADRYAADFAVEAMRREGITLKPASRAKSDLYKELLPLLNSGVVELLDNERLRNQLVSLERRTARGGRDSIDHPPGGHDDVANAVAGVVVLAATAPKYTAATWGRERPATSERATMRRRGPIYRINDVEVTPSEYRRAVRQTRGIHKHAES